MASSKTRTGRTRRDAVRADVLEAVERLLEQGESFTSLGVARIAEEAGVARSAFYTNFADKKDLLMQLTETATEEIFTASAAWIASDPALGVDGLSTTHERSISVFREHRAVLTAYAEVAAYDPEVAKVWTDRVDALVGDLTKRIRRGQRAGEISQRLAPEATAKFIVWGAERTMSQHTATQAGGDARLAREMAQAVWALLYGTS